MKMRSWNESGTEGASRRKGERSPASNEQQFPRIVELRVPENGFGVVLDAT